MINPNTKLVLHDLYYYDIVACYPTILKTQAFDLSGVDMNNKQERSEFIGKKQINNVNMSSYLMESANSLVSYYLLDNNVPEEDIIMTQRDGFILTKPLSHNEGSIKMEMRRVIDYMIISIDRKKYLECSNGIIKVKGIKHVYPRMEQDVYSRFSDLDFYNKKRLFGQMSAIKNIIYDNNDINFFAIPLDENTFAFSTYKGDIAVKDIELVSVNTVDKDKYFNNYVKPFLDSLFIDSY